MLSDKFLTFFELSRSVGGGIEGAVDIILGSCFCACASYRCSGRGLAIIFRNGDTGGMEVADSGDEEGDESASKGESKVEFVVVGEESVDVVVMEATLSRCERVGCRDEE